MPSVRPERRREALNEMVAATRQALQILTQCLATPQAGDRTHKQVRGFSVGVVGGPGRLH